MIFGVLFAVALGWALLVVKRARCEQRSFWLVVILAALPFWCVSLLAYLTYLR